ncbi:hypothetical protein N7507_003453 [Penicillium longicatenatum]|nr:hypothetical protein N7507_003453 [Penicillium longicatenatum]
MASLSDRFISNLFSSKSLQTCQCVAENVVRTTWNVVRNPGDKAATCGCHMIVALELGSSSSSIPVSMQMQQRGQG